MIQGCKAGSKGSQKQIPKVMEMWSLAFGKNVMIRDVKFGKNKT